MTTAIALTGDPALALHYGEAVDLTELSVVGLITHAAETLGEAFVEMNRYHRLVVEVDGVGRGDRFQLVHDRGLFIGCHTKPLDQNRIQRLISTILETLAESS